MIHKTNSTSPQATKEILISAAAKITPELSINYLYKICCILSIGTSIFALLLINYGPIVYIWSFNLLRKISQNTHSTMFSYNKAQTDKTENKDQKESNLKQEIVLINEEKIPVTYSPSECTILSFVPKASHSEETDRTEGDMGVYIPDDYRMSLENKPKVQNITKNHYAFTEIDSPNSEYLTPDTGNTTPCSGVSDLNGKNDFNSKKPVHEIPLYENSKNEIGPTLDELSRRTISEDRLRKAIELPLGWNRTKMISELTSQIVQSYGFADVKLTYTSMMAKLSLGLDSLSELSYPSNSYMITNTRHALSFAQAYMHQLGGVSQALLDVVNGVRDIEKFSKVIQEYGRELELRFSPSKQRSESIKETTSQFTKKFEALLRLHQLFNEYRQVGRSRREAMILACFKESLLRSKNFLTQLNYLQGQEFKDILTQGQAIERYAKNFYDEAQSLSILWNKLQPVLKKQTRILRRGLSEENADRVMDCANRLLTLCRELHQFQEGILRKYGQSAESELLKLLLYIDKNRLCIRLSEKITFDRLLQEAVLLLNTVKEDTYTAEMLTWLNS